jgi:hypothetical protein
VRAAALLLLSVIACGKGAEAPAQTTTPPPALATALEYQDPSGSGWRLVRDSASTPSKLLLNLVGPAGLKTRGAGFNLRAPAAVHFIYFDETRFPLRDLGVYELRNIQPVGDPDPLDPVLLAGAVQKGNKLTVAMFQKDRRAGAKESGVPLFQIGLQLDPAAQAHAGDELALAVVKSQFMAEDIGAFSGSPTVEMVEKGHLQNMTVAVGSLHAR